MQALEFTKALREIVGELKVRDILAILDPWLKTGNVGVSEPQKQQLTSVLFDANAGFRQLMTQSATRSVLDSLNAREFLEPSRLTTIVQSLQGISQSSQINGNVMMFQNFFTFAELLRSLMKMQATSEQLLEKQKIGEIAPTEGIVELELFEYADEVGVSSTRVRVFVSSLIELHTVIALTYDLKQDQLTFRYFDSGSGLLVGATCAKQIADTMNNLLSLWDKIRFWKQDALERNLLSATKALEFAEKVHQQVANKVISAEDGENFKARAFEQVEKLTGIGATVPLRGHVTVDQRQLLTEMRNTKLLTGTTEAKEEHPKTSTAE
jgi:hypothetical protein